MGYEIRSLERAFVVLDHLAALGGEASVSQLAAASELPLPSVHRIVRSLLAFGALRQLPTRRYTLGPRLIGLGNVAGSVLGTAARPHLVSLAAATGESANLAILDANRAVYVAHVSSRQSVRLFTEVGQRVLLHSTGVGKAMLAALAEPELERLLRDEPLVARTPGTITDPAALRAELDAVRARGYAIDDEEEELEVRCVAIAITGTAGWVGAVSVSAPAHRFGPDELAAAASALGATARAVGASLQRPG